jgi:signal transduction histidine kinase
MLGISMDITERKRTEDELGRHREHLEHLVTDRTAELQASNEKLRMADRLASIGTLAAGLGHDMNNVLLPVRAHINALRASGEAGNLSRPDRGHVDEVRKSVTYLQQLADGLHFLAMNPDTEEDARGGGGTTDLRQWWAQAGALLSKAAPKHARVSASFPTDLPLVTIPAHALTQAVLNLVVNAGEAIPPPSVRRRRQGHVRLWAECADDSYGAWVRLGVTDNGTGMSEEVKRRAFEMFFTTKPRGLGTGLGLALVRKVAEHNGGRVEVETEVGKGTTIVMVLPAVATPATEVAEKPGAVITIANGRAAALIRHLLESGGTPVRPDADAAKARLWVVDPAVAGLDDVKSWRTNVPDGRLVLFGTPGPDKREAWLALDPVSIDNPDDFESLRSALNRALAIA